MKSQPTRSGPVIERRLPTIHYVLLLSLFVGTAVLFTGTAATASPPSSPSGVVPASLSTDVQEQNVSVLSGAAADRCAHAAHHVGYRTRQRLVMAVAVGMAESHCRTFVRHWSRPTPGCPNGSLDRGMWQINDCYHREVSSRCAHNALCSARVAYRISRHGRDWRPWAAYQNGSYRGILHQARAAVNRLH
jgi:hypothetical protein